MKAHALESPVERLTRQLLTGGKARHEYHSRETGKWTSVLTTIAETPSGVLASTRRVIPAPDSLPPGATQHHLAFFSKMHGRVFEAAVGKRRELGPSSVYPGAVGVASAIEMEADAAEKSGPFIIVHQLQACAKIGDSPELTARVINDHKDWKTAALEYFFGIAKAKEMKNIALKLRTAKEIAKDGPGGKGNEKLFTQLAKAKGFRVIHQEFPDKDGVSQYVVAEKD